VKEEELLITITDTVPSGWIGISCISSGLILTTEDIITTIRGAVYAVTAALIADTLTAVELLPVVIMEESAEIPMD
jgi:hypothetical protein